MERRPTIKTIDRIHRFICSREGVTRYVIENELPCNWSTVDAATSWLEKKGLVDVDEQEVRGKVAKYYRCKQEDVDELPRGGEGE